MGVKEKLTRFAGKALLTGKKYSPEILLGAGLASGAATLYFACKETITAGEVLDRHKAAMDEIHEALELEDPDFGKREAQINTVKVYGRTAWEMFRNYAPAIIFGSLSVGCILASHGIMRKRNLALAASLVTVRSAFDEYRGRVRRDLGDDMDRHFMYDTVEKTIEHEETDEDGKTKKVKEKLVLPTGAIGYDRFFDEANPQWEKDGAANYLFVRSQLVTLRNMQIARGYLFLNEVYDMLGFTITVAGQGAGWIYDPSNPEGTLIGFEGFDLSEIGLSDQVRAFKNGYERCVLLHFENIRDDILTDLPRVDSRIDQI